MSEKNEPVSERDTRKEAMTTPQSEPKGTQYRKLRPSFNDAEAGWREADAHYLEMDRTDYIFRARRYITALEDALEQWEATQ